VKEILDFASIHAELSCIFAILSFASFIAALTCLYYCVKTIVYGIFLGTSNDDEPEDCLAGSPGGKDDEERVEL